MQAGAKTWILTGSPENFAATREHGFALIGAKEGRRSPALQIEPGDRIVSSLTKLAFQGHLRTVSEHDADVLMTHLRARAGLRA